MVVNEPADRPASVAGGLVDSSVSLVHSAPTLVGEASPSADHNSGYDENVVSNDALDEGLDYADSLALGVGMVLALTIVQRGIGFLRNILLCRILEPSELGLWNFAFSAVIFLSPFLVLGIPGVFGRYLEHYRQRGQMVPFLRRCLMATFGMMAAGMVVMLWMASQTSWLVFGDTSHIRLTVVMIVGLGFVISFNTMIELCTALRQVRLLSYLQFANGALFAVLALGFAYVYEASAISIMAGYAAACFLTTSAAIVPIWRIVSRTAVSTTPISQRHLWTKILPFAGSLWIVAFFSNLFAAADRYMILHFCDAGPDVAAALVGQYHSSLIFPILIVSVGTMLGSVILPYLCHDWEQGNRAAVSARLNEIIRLFAIGATAAGACVLLISPWLFSFALADKYTLGLTVLPMTLVYCIWYGIFNIQQNYLFCLERAGQVSVAMFLGLVVNVVLNYLLLPRFGLQGAVAATSIANAGALGYGVFWASRRGMSISKSTIAALFLPLCLLGGGSVAVSLLVVYVVVGLRREWIVDAAHLDFAIRKVTEVVRKTLALPRQSSQA